MEQITPLAGLWEGGSGIRVPTGSHGLGKNLTAIIINEKKISITKYLRLTIAFWTRTVWRKENYPRRFRLYWLPPQLNSMRNLL
jgi:hypothetical protein